MGRFPKEFEEAKDLLAVINEEEDRNVRYEAHCHFLDEVME